MSRKGSAMEDRLVALYEQGGQSAIYDYVNAHHPDWAWARCDRCDDDTPTWAGVCAVCFDTRPDLEVAR